jgi:hypothetical protein
MQSPPDQALLNTTAGAIGAWVGGFIIIIMVIAYILLRFAGSPKRKPGTAVTLRAIAIVVALFLAYAGYTGSGGAVNIGSVLAVVVTIAWAAKQQFTRKTAA